MLGKEAHDERVGCPTCFKDRLGVGQVVTKEDDIGILKSVVILKICLDSERVSQCGDAYGRQRRVCREDFGGFGGQRHRRAGRGRPLWGQGRARGGRALKRAVALGRDGVGVLWFDRERLLQAVTITRMMPMIRGFQIR